MLTARPSRPPNEADAPRLIALPGTPAGRPASVDLGPPISALAGEIDAVAANLLAGLRASSDFSPWGHGVEWERFAELTAESLRSSSPFCPTMLLPRVASLSISRSSTPISPSLPTCATCSAGSSVKVMSGTRGAVRSSEPLI
jgi:hypothetical protein